LKGVSMSEWWHKTWFHQWFHRDYIKALEKAYSIMSQYQKQQMRDWTKEQKL